MGFKQSNYTGITPNTTNQPMYNQPAQQGYAQPMGQPMMQQGYVQQPTQNALQYNVNRFAQLIGDVVAYKWQRCEITQQAANMVSVYLRNNLNNGAYSKRIFDNFGNTMATDNQLRQLIDYCISEWVQQVSSSGVNVAGMSQQPMYNQPNGYYNQPVQQGYAQPMGQPMMQPNGYYNPQMGQPNNLLMPQNGYYNQPNGYYNPQMGQPMMQQGYGQPMGQSAYNGNTQLYTSNVANTNTMYNTQRNNSATSVDNIYGKASGAKQSSMYSSAPVQTMTGNQVYTQAPQVSTYNAPKQMPPEERRRLLTPTNALRKNPVTTTANTVNTNMVQAVDDKQYIPVTVNPKVVSLTQAEIDELYPKDGYNFREKYFEFVKLMKVEYYHKLYVDRGEHKGIKGDTVNMQIIELREESAPSNTAAIKRVLAANKGHNDSKPFAYKIGYNKEVVLDIPYSIGMTNHDNMQRVWSEFVDPEDNDSIFKILDTKPFEVAKALIVHFRKAHPQYQKALEPMIVAMYNNVIDTASVVRNSSGKFNKMTTATTMDDIYNACCLTDDSTYGVFKTLQSYSVVLMNALNSSLFAVYSPLVTHNYLNYSDEKDRATALANPEIGVVVNYVTDRHLVDAKVDDKPVDEKTLKTLVDNELKQHFVLTINKCTIYTNLELPFAKKPTKFNLAPGYVDVKNGLTNIFGILAFTQTLGGAYAPANICVPEIVLANDKTTEKVPYVVVSTMDDNALISRVVAA